MPRIPAIPDPVLSLRDLRVVVAVAQAGATSRAASMLHLTQPAVSRALLGIEERLGAQLFQRLPRGLRPTPRGEQLVKDAAGVLASMSEVERAFLSPETLPATVRMVCECYTAYHWLPTALVRLRDAAPRLRVTLAIQHTAAPAAALAAGEIDVALLTSKTLPKGVSAMPLFADEIVFLVAASHPLATRKHLRPADLVEHTIVTSKVPKEEAAWFFGAVFGKKRPALNVLTIPLTEAVLEVARAGMGIAAVSEWVVAPHLGRGDLVVKRLAKGPLQRPWTLAYRNESRVVAERLQGILRQMRPASVTPSATPLA